MRWKLTLLLLLLIMPLVSATSINLLAYGEGTGSIARLILETQPGTGRVFIETNTLIDTDTQDSIILGREIVCAEYKLSCSNKDFFYTIHSGSPIVTGPSGGAASAILTYSHLKKKKIPNIAITGTINSGGFIGTVGGVEEKIIAAKQNNIESTFIPIGNMKIMRDNESVSTLSFSEELNHTVIVVGTIHDILVELFNLKEKNINYEKPEIFQTQMRMIANELCDRAKSISIESTNLSRDLLNQSEIAIELEDYYSAASFCFGAGVDLRKKEFENYSIENIEAMLDFIKESSKDTYNAITRLDLEVKSIVAERLQDANQAVIDAKNQSEKNAKNSYAYAFERFNTAKIWSSFYNLTGSEVVEIEALPQICEAKILESNRRIQYLRRYFIGGLQADQTILKAREAQSREEFSYCIFLAGKAKAEAEIVASVIGFDEEHIDVLLKTKSKIARELVAKSLSEKDFPLLGLSYLEYGTSLEERDPYSALLYYQLAAEISDIKLPGVKKEKWKFYFGTWQYFVLGIAIGLLTAGIGLKTYEATGRSRQPHRKKR
jgi:predicted S18 family serine protease